MRSGGDCGVGVPDEIRSRALFGFDQNASSNRIGLSIAEWHAFPKQSIRSEDNRLHHAKSLLLIPQPALDCTGGPSVESPGPVKPSHFVADSQHYRRVAKRVREPTLRCRTLRHSWSGKWGEVPPASNQTGAVTLVLSPFALVLICLARPTGQHWIGPRTRGACRRH